MRIHWLQHVEFEGLGGIADWADKNGHHLRGCRLYAGDPLPDLADFELLIVMGGPMGVHDEGLYSWLAEEKGFIRRAIEVGKGVVGICLGAQLIAAVLGATVGANREKEIGWFPVRRCPECPPALRSIFPAEQIVFHWHGDTFSLPEGAIPLCASAICVNQGFVYGERVLALQFHLETTPLSAATLIDNCRAELVGGPWIQGEEELRAGFVHCPGINEVMERLLSSLASLVGEER